jgi:hypothetical protein
LDDFLPNGINSLILFFCSFRKKMKNRVLLWIPRSVTAILFILITMFIALEVFSENKPLADRIIGFSIHMMPAWVILLGFIASFFRTLLSGILYVVIAVYFTVFFHTYHSFSLFLFMSLPFFIIGFIYFFFNFKLKIK